MVEKGKDYELETKGGGTALGAHHHFRQPAAPCTACPDGTVHSSHMWEYRVFRRTDARLNHPACRMKEASPNDTSHVKAPVSHAVCFASFRTNSCLEGAKLVGVAR